ncbi:DUF423 domain-containing protein [Belliella sp. DSM 107340]|uniref:DUF423 domain-containing protein n=1 Tax=Belliella calami TaxID=2923436 RepID=A0ABS9UL17_9BACT|nr:DUF423 domain-containing protein [Belliella calami]MCH7397228.1 DUF423 domain-containing protein [Belliella calami]
MKNTKYIQLAAVLGALAVGIGAFGAHGLEEILTKNGQIDTFETGVKYHFYHTLAIAIVGVLIVNFPKAKHLSSAAFLFLVGIIIFSGSLYTLSLTGITWLGAITPLGGVAFILGWIFLFLGARSLNQ